MKITIIFCLFLMVIPLFAEDMELMSRDAVKVLVTGEMVKLAYRNHIKNLEQLDAQLQFVEKFIDSGHLLEVSLIAHDTDSHYSNKPRWVVTFEVKQGIYFLKKIDVPGMKEYNCVAKAIPNYPNIMATLVFKVKAGADVTGMIDAVPVEKITRHLNAIRVSNILTSPNYKIDVIFFIEFEKADT